MPSRHTLDSVQSTPPPTITQQIAMTQALNQSRDALCRQNDERQKEIKRGVRRKKSLSEEEKTSHEQLRAMNLPDRDRSLLRY